MRKFTKRVYLRVYFLFFLTYSTGSNASLKVHSIITVGMIGPRSILLFFLCRFPGLSPNFKWIHDSLDWDVWRFNAQIRSISIKFARKFRINFDLFFIGRIYRFSDIRVSLLSGTVGISWQIFHTLLVSDLCMVFFRDHRNCMFLHNTFWNILQILDGHSLLLIRLKFFLNWLLNQYWSR